MNKPSQPLKFSANLSFLFTEVPFLDRFALAAQAGFTGVEFHFPYEHDAAVIAEVSMTSGVDIVLFNLPPGNWDAGERGIACHPERVSEFRAGVAQAIDYAQVLDVPRLNCLCGIPPVGANLAKVRSTLIDNLRFAAAETARAGIQLLIEPLNTRDTPGFLIATSRRALELIAEVNHPNLRLQFDLYHAQVMEGDLAMTLRNHLPQIGHIQLADNPGRHQPGTGEINFPFLFGVLEQLGYSGWIGAEYKPSGGTRDSLGWRT
jgi:hydroxypyruvate isomerase